MKSITFKIVFWSLVLVSVSCVSLIFWSNRIIKNQLIERENFLNSDQARIFSSQIQQNLQNISAKSNLLAASMLSKTVGKNISPTEFVDSEIMSIEIYSSENGKINLTKKATNNSFLKTHSLNGEFIDHLRQMNNFPWRAAFSGEVIVRNSSLPGGIPVLTLSYPYDKYSTGEAHNVVFVDFRMDAIQNVFSVSKDKTLFAIDREGHLLAHQIEKLALSGKDLSSIPAVSQALGSTLNEGNTEFYDPETGDRFLAAFSKTSWGVTIIALASESKLMSEYGKSKRQLWFITGLLLSLTLFIAILISSSISKPIVNLTEKIQVAGETGANLILQVESDDETADLVIALSKYAEKNLKTR